MKVAVVLPYASFVEVNMCRAFEKAGINCWLVTSDKQRFEYRGTGIEFERFAKTLELPCLFDSSVLRQYAPFPIMLDVLTAVKNLNVDIVSVSEHVSPTTWLFSSLKQKWKVVLTEHGHVWDSIRDRIYNFSASRLVIPRIEGFVGIGLRAKRFLEKMGAQNVKVIPNPIDCNLFNISSDYRDRANIVLYVGQVDTWRGVHVLLKAMEAVKKQVKDVKLWIVGANGDLSSYIKKNPLFNHIGAKSHLEMPRYYNQAKVYVDPFLSYKRAGCGCALSEALACGTPVVGTRHLDFPFVWKDGEVGYLANDVTPESLAAAIIRAISRGNEMQDNCRQLAVRDFSHKSVGTKYLEAFKEVGNA